MCLPGASSKSAWCSAGAGAVPTAAGALGTGVVAEASAVAAGGGSMVTIAEPGVATTCTLPGSALMASMRFCASSACAFSLAVASAMNFSNAATASG